ncbi:reverse transcriptase domain-containing protein [Tanacetum coccineum]
MHIWRERRSVLGLRGQHARNQSLSIKSGSGDEATITPNIKRSSKPKWQAGKLKQCIAELPMVTAQKPKEELIMYLCTSWGAISAVLLAERDSRQISIYFVSRTLQTIEINYNLMEKLVLAIVHATRRLRRPRTSIRGQILADFIAEKPNEEGPSMEVQAKEAIPEP